jgi:hypothetical protein
MGETFGLMSRGTPQALLTLVSLLSGGHREERRPFSGSEKMCPMAAGLASSLGIRPALQEIAKTREKRNNQLAVPDLSMV